MTRPTLALCIPTFQRADCLEILLTSAASQKPGFDEVVISDDASRDHTADVVDNFASRFTSLVYRPQSENVGLDQNFRDVVELSTADFIWFMGDDDRLRAGAVAAFHGALRAFPDVLGMTFSSVDYDNRLEHVTGLKKLIETEVFTGRSQLFMRHIDLLGFMSTTIVRRDAWVAAPKHGIGEFDNLYSQVHRIGSLIGDNGQWLVSSRLAVDYRSDNDQFKHPVGGELPRLMRDVTSYDSILSDLFAGDKLAYQKTSDRVLQTHVVSRVRNAKTSTKQFPIITALTFLAKFYSGHSYFWLSIVPTSLAPRGLLRLVKGAYRRFAFQSGARRARSLETNG